MDIKDVHWLLPALQTFENTGSNDKINAIKSFVDDVDILSEDNEMLPALKLMEANIVEQGFYAIIDINLNLYALQIGCHPTIKMLQFSTVGEQPEMTVRVNWDDVLLISKNPLAVTLDDMYNRYERQLIQVYRQASKHIELDEVDPTISRITKSLQEIHSPWCLNTQQKNTLP